MLKRSKVKKIDIFRGLSKANMDELMSWMKLIEYPLNRTIFREGYKADGMYLLLEGNVVVMKSTPKGSFGLDELEAPSFFGEISLLIDERRTTGIKALSPVRLGFLPKDLFLEKIQKDNSTALLIVANLAKLLSQRLMDTNEQLEILTSRDRGKMRRKIGKIGDPQLLNIHKTSHL